MIISKVMTRNPVWIRPDATIKDAVDLMRKEGISHLPVLDKRDRLCGVITRKDLRDAEPSAATSLDVYEARSLLTKLKVEQVMEKHVMTVDENEVVEEAARVMIDRSISCLPVMRDSLLVGIITVKDLFKLFIDAFGARRPGIRAILSMDEKPGQLAKLSTALAGQGSDIISMVTTPGEDRTKTIVTIKMDGISKEQFEQMVSSIDGMTIEDVR
jgi:acetoin utilization protein AcuB